MPVTIYRLGEMMPAGDNGVPNERALTHLLLTAFYRLGACPDVPMPTDYTPVDEAASLLVSGLTDADDAVVHVFHGRGVSLTDVPAMAGRRLRRVSPAEFAAMLRDSGMTVLLGLITSPDGTTVDLRTLLTDNPGLFTKEDRRGGLADGPLDAAIAAYHESLAGGHD
jgi:hypothetical protein